MATIKDVARQANVSVATVSRILNDLPGYSEATKKRVLKAIRDLGYTKNALASGLVSSKTHTIAVLFPSVSSRFASELLSGIENGAHERRHSVIVCNTDSNGRRTREYLEVLAQKRVDGVVFVSEWLTEEYETFVERTGLPMVLVSTFTSEYPVPYVRIDDQKAAYDATMYLLERGHRRIGMISGTKEDPVAGYPRVQGYREAVEQYGAAFEESLVAYGDFHYASGRRAAQELLARHGDVTAVFAASDEMALGVVSAAYECGLRIPDDLSLIGYDDTGDAEMAVPPLTTVRQPLFDMGRKAIDLLFDPVAHSIIMPHTITERRSVRVIEGGRVGHRGGS